MEICIFKKNNKINSYKTVCQFTKQPYNIFQILLADGTIQKLKRVIGYFKVKFDKIWLRQMTYNVLVL